MCFLEGLVYFKGRWFLYYGTADSKIAVAVAAKYNYAGHPKVVPDPTLSDIAGVVEDEGEGEGYVEVEERAGAEV